MSAAPSSSSPASSSPPSSSPPPAPFLRALVMTPDDREFLPAALEILETPPSPVKLALIRVMAAFVMVALIWGFFGRLDVIAIGQGKVQPPGRVKVVQPTETGRVSRIGAQNGDRVANGDVLLDMDPTEANADREALAAQVASLRAEILRREIAISADPSDVKRPPVDWPAETPAPVRQRENAVLAADLDQLRAMLASTDAQSDQKKREVQRLHSTIGAQAVLVDTLKERVNMRSALATNGFGTRASLIDSKEILQKEETALAALSGQRIEAEAALDVLARDRARITQSFLTDNTQKRAEAQRTLDDAAQRLAKAVKRLDNLSLRSPADGVVQASAIYTIGQVVSAGQEIMRIVPESAVMEVEAYLPNKDIGFVREGQEVGIKIDSFPYTRYGILSGTVTRVARDAIAQPEAAQIEGNPARTSESQLFAGAQRTQNLVFPVTIQLARKSLTIDGQEVALSPGMTVVAEIKTGSRRILEYIFSPVYEVTSEAMRER